MSSLLSAVSPYLPQHEGLLPKWLLLVSVISVANSVQAYSTLKFTRRVYSGTVNPKTNDAYPSTSPVTPLSARTFGTWTLITSIVRLYAAYNIDDPIVYQLGLWTYAIAWLHFVSEWFIFKTARWGAGLAGPVFVATGSLLWMSLQWGFYVK